MRKTIYVCDRCGQEIKGYGAITLPFKPGEEGVSEREDQKHLCSDCMDQFRQWVNKGPVEAMPSSGETDNVKCDIPGMNFIPIPHDIQRRKDIDDGKISALSAAGWTQKAIAEEMHVVPSVISAHIKKMKEKKQ